MKHLGEHLWTRRTARYQTDSHLVNATEMGEYEGTVGVQRFVVLLRHCHVRSRRAAWGCVGKIRASYLAFVIRAL